MGLNCCLAEGQLLGKLGVAQAAGQQPQNIEFSGGEAGQFTTHQRGKSTTSSWSKNVRPVSLAGSGSSAGLRRDEQEPVPAGYDWPCAGVLIQGAKAVLVFLKAVPRD